MGPLPMKRILSVPSPAACRRLCRPATTASLGAASTLVFRQRSPTPIVTHHLLLTLWGTCARSHSAHPLTQPPLSLANLILSPHRLQSPRASLPTTSMSASARTVARATARRVFASATQATPTITATPRPPSFKRCPFGITSFLPPPRHSQIKCSQIPRRERSELRSIALFSALRVCC